MKELIISERSHTISYNGKECTLDEYIQQAQTEYWQHQDERKEKTGRYSEIRFQDEELIWAIQDWFGLVGEFSEEELTYLEEIWDLDQMDIEKICLEEN